MSDLRHTERGFRWSPCSVASFHHFLNGDTASCLYNPPHEDDSLPRVLPGKLLTLDAQCRRDRGTSACFKDDRVCAQLFCFDAGSGYCVAYRPAAEGSSCGDGQYCLNGRCVAEHENIIPDYSQNTPAYVRQDGSTSSGRALSFNQGGNYNNNRASTPAQQNSPYAPYRPFQYQNPNPSSQRTTFPSSTYRSFPNFSVSNTKSPYDFQHFTNRPVTQIYDNLHTISTTKVTVATISSTLNPYIGNYYELRQRTTKSPYNFADFGKHLKNTNIENDDNLNKNYLKRSYVSDNFFMESNNSKNSTEIVAGPRH
ncbi:hypothetical protein AMK59_1687 [Oryctes borbonicus]|uniref:ADAMTS cysteine-rich domain-containing protein n=1 Tax=Oryctes borbonicus TaxID=1629725 RepID=A0A0T6BBJ2_9SCAR|nr:hypothetical protein AMK59_1687 [Oryctes borbonicus]